MLWTIETEVQEKCPDSVQICSCEKATQTLGMSISQVQHSNRYKAAILELVSFEDFSSDKTVA